jgi:PIN domain nuclease of toxin-antitoxin system
MDLLLDTHILLWHLTDNPKLSVEKSSIIESSENRKFFSVASLWEMAIKASLGKLALQKPLDLLVPQEITVLEIKLGHLKKLQELPFHHKDPFDRLLIAQAMTENLTIMTDDEQFSKYDVQLL